MFNRISLVFFLRSAVNFCFLLFLLGSLFVFWYHFAQKKDCLLQSSVTCAVQVMLTKMNGNKNCSSFECDLDYSAEIVCQYWIEL